MGYFKGIEDAKTSEGGLYVVPGNYKVNILEAKVIESRKKIPFFCVETEVLETTNPERPIGTKMSWLVNLTQDSAQGNIKSFIAGVTGCSTDEVTEVLVEELLESGELANTPAKINAFNVVTKAGKDFTRVQWVA